MNYDIEDLSVQVVRTAQALEKNMSHIVSVDFIEMVLVQFVFNETLPYSPKVRQQALLILESKVNKGECQALNCNKREASFKCMQIAISDELEAIAQSTASAMARVENFINNSDTIHVKMEQSQLVYTIKSIFNECFNPHLKSLKFLMGKHRLNLPLLTVNGFTQELFELYSQRDFISSDADDITKQMLKQNAAFVEHVYTAFENAMSCNTTLLPEEKDMACNRCKEFLSIYKYDVERKLNGDTVPTVAVSSESSYTQRLRLKRNLQSNPGNHKFTL